MINKNNEGYFSDHDCAVFEKYLQFCGLGLRNAQLYERSLLEVKRNQVLLDLAGVIFQEQSTLEQMMSRILTHVLSFIQCERASVLLGEWRPDWAKNKKFPLFSPNPLKIGKICNL